jgi:3-methyladenine DNA glycosylase/8-oxoguanine DNA glycosylase
MMLSLTVTTPVDFRFRETVESHGWYQLAPFVYDSITGVLSRKLRLSNGQIVTLNLRGTKTRAIQVHILSARVLTSSLRYQVIRAVQNMFSLDINLRDFYKLMQKTDGYEWVDVHKAGRMLAAPTVWEDLAKTLMTTNIAWSGTKEMARKLVSLDPDGVFPTPQQVSNISEEELTQQTGMGYRAPYLHTLARRISSGELNVENWRLLNSDELYKAITDLNGFGDYAAGTMLRLLGHFDKLAIDSVARNAYEQVIGHKPESDTDIRTHYEAFGKWRGLVLWMDCIRDQYVPEPETG